MRVLMTGGTGLIGRALTSELVAAGHAVTILTRRPEGHLPGGAEYVAWDGSTLAEASRLVEQCDAVIHLAGQSIAGENTFSILFRRWSPGVKREILASRLRAGEGLLRAIEGAHSKPKVFLQSSAVGYYGADVRYPVDETAPPGEDFLARVCVAWEQSSARVEAWGMRRAILRSGVVLSSEGGVLPMVALPFRFFAGGRLGDGRQPFSWIHVHDEARAIRFLLEDSGASGAFNLVAPHLITNADLAHTLSPALRRPGWLPVPAFALRALLGEKASLVLQGQQVLPRRLESLGFSYSFPRIEPALHDLLR
jgi:hypothetical protein